MPAPFVPTGAFVDSKTGTLTVEARLFLEWFSDLFRGTPATCTVTWGTGSPENVITASVGSLFLRTDSASTLYVKQTGTSNTGWILK